MELLCGSDVVGSRRRRQLMGGSAHCDNMNWPYGSLVGNSTPAGHARTVARQSSGRVFYVHAPSHAPKPHVAGERMLVQRYTQRLTRAEQCQAVKREVCGSRLIRQQPISCTSQRKRSDWPLHTEMRGAEALSLRERKLEMYGRWKMSAYKEFHGVGFGPPVQLDATYFHY